MNGGVEQANMALVATLSRTRTVQNTQRLPVKGALPNRGTQVRRLSGPHTVAAKIPSKF